MKRNTFQIATIAVATLGTTTQSCVALATTSVGLTVLKQILLGGITKGFNIFSDKNNFLNNQLIDDALPSQLRDMNSTLHKMGLSHLVKKEKEFIAEAAAFTVNTSRPILINAVNSLSAEDAARIVQGGSGSATQLLKERTSAQLMSAIAPKVEQELNKYGIVKTINTALSGSNLLGTLLGGGNNNNNVNAGGLSMLASEQIVNGLFNIIEDHEKQNSASLLGPFGK